MAVNCLLPAAVAILSAAVA